MPRPQRASGERVVAKTSLITGKVTVKTPPGYSLVARKALEVHEEVHAAQWRRMGVARFVAARLRPAKRWELEKEAYRAEILYLLGVAGRERIHPDRWVSMIVEKNYAPLREVQEFVYEVFSSFDG